MGALPHVTLLVGEHGSFHVRSMGSTAKQEPFDISGVNSWHAT